MEELVTNWFDPPSCNSVSGSGKDNWSWSVSKLGKLDDKPEEPSREIPDGVVRFENSVGKLEGVRPSS